MDDAPAMTPETPQDELVEPPLRSKGLGAAGADKQGPAVDGRDETGRPVRVP